MKKLFFGILLCGVLLHSPLFGEAVKIAHVAQPSPQPSGAQAYMPNQIVIKFTSTMLNQLDPGALFQGKTAHAPLDRLGQRFGVDRIGRQFPGAKEKIYRGKKIDLGAWYKIRFHGKADVGDVVRAYKAIPGVIDAQPIGVHQLYAAPNDPYYPDQWHLDQALSHHIDMERAWDMESGNPDIIVAIMDSGVRYFHKDLGGSNGSYANPTDVAGNMWINGSEKNGTPGVDDDGNGFVDDWIGWDFVDGVLASPSGEDGDTPDNDPRDFNGHGTHCAGIVAALNNNGYGLSSVSGGWGNGAFQTSGNGVKIMPLRVGWNQYVFLQGDMGYVSMDFAAQAFYYAADNGAKIVSCSWGSSDTGGLADAIDYFLASGGLIFKAAGNADDEATDYMTARNDIIAVAATDSNDIKADFSSYGDWVDISAPGEAIYSLYHDYDNPENDYIASLSGTSMSTPLAAGVAALIWSKWPEWTGPQVKERLLATADNIDDLSGNASYQGKLGTGRVNAYKAVSDNTTVPLDADFSAAPLSGYAPMDVNFTDQSSGDISTWAWDFGDGTTSADRHPSHTYDHPGTYTVTLTISNDTNSASIEKSDYIDVKDMGDHIMHVDMIDVTRQSFLYWSRAKARVRIVDVNGALISAATVTGNWSGRINASVQFTTDDAGVGTYQTNWAFNTGAGFEYCVTDVDKTDHTYDPDGNTATCDEVF